MYKPITDKEFETFPLKDIAADQNGFVGMNLPNYPALWSKEKYFLDDVLAVLQNDPHEITEHLYEELAWLSNKVLACDGIDLSSEEKVVKGIELSRAMVSIGLEIKCGEDILKAKKLILERWLEILFRVSVTKLLRLRERAFGVLKKYWYGDLGAFLSFLGLPYEHIFQGLLQRFPEHYDARVKKKDHPFRHFYSLEEVDRAERSLRQIEEIHQMIVERFHELYDRMRKEDDPLMEPSLVAALGTIFAFYISENKIGGEPLKPSQLTQFVDKAFELKGSRKYIKQECKDGFLNALYHESNQELMRPLWGLVFQELEEEIGGGKEGAFDLRFLKSVWSQV